MSDLYSLDGTEGTTTFPLFETSVALYSWDGAPDAYVESCVQHLQSLPDATVTHLCEASIRYCNDFLDAIGEEPRAFATPRDVLTLILPRSMVVPAPQSDAPVVHLELECDWEPEHGLEWIVRAGRVIVVGPYEGNDPWAEPDPADRYVFG